eukprot:768317-Hanusia_phi.AAC.10
MGCVCECADNGAIVSYRPPHRRLQARRLHPHGPAHAGHGRVRGGRRKRSPAAGDALEQATQKIRKELNMSELPVVALTAEVRGGRECEDKTRTGGGAKREEEGARGRSVGE